MYAHPTRALCAGVALLLLAGCSESKEAKAPSEGSKPATVFDGKVMVDGGRHLGARCVGSGAPTVVLEVGGSGFMGDWPTSFVNLVAESTTTCLYSRAGGRGSSNVAHLTRAQLVDDTFTLLDTLHTEHGVDGPYVFVGWSLGGAAALANALEHPERTVGLVLLDSSFPADFIPACVASGHSQSECDAKYAEDLDAKSIEKEIASLVRPLPEIEVANFTALTLPDCRLESGATSVTIEIAGTDLSAPNCDALESAVADKNVKDWSKLSPKFTDTRIDATHEGIVKDAAKEIAATVLRIVKSAR